MFQSHFFSIIIIFELPFNKKFFKSTLYAAMKYFDSFKMFFNCISQSDTKKLILSLEMCRLCKLEFFNKVQYI